MHLSVVLIAAVATILWLPNVPRVVVAQTTYIEEIPVNAPVAWYPQFMDVIVGFYTHVLCNLIEIYKIAKYRLERQNALLKQFPPFYGSIGLYYDGDHLRSVLARSSNFDEIRSANYSVPQPKVALDVVDSVKILMENLKQLKN